MNSLVLWFPVFWLLFTLGVLPFLLGSLVLLNPFVPLLRQWLSGMTALDFINTFVFPYALLMSFVGIASGIYREKNEARDTLCTFMGVTALAILALLLWGKFVAV